MSQEGVGEGHKDTFLDFAIICLDAGVKAQGEIGKNVEIIKQIWKVANQETRDFVCYRAIDSFRGFDLYNIPDLKTVIQEIKDHRWVKDLYSNVPIVTNTTESTTGNKTPEKNETTFWSEHKGKIALGVVGLCAVGAIAAYVLAYPAVALALTVLAAVILMGAGIAKVLEDPNVEKPFTPQQEK